MVSQIWQFWGYVPKGCFNGNPFAFSCAVSACSHPCKSLWNWSPHLHSHAAESLLASPICNSSAHPKCNESLTWASHVRFLSFCHALGKLCIPVGKAVWEQCAKTCLHSPYEAIDVMFAHCCLLPVCVCHLWLAFVT